MEERSNSRHMILAALLSSGLVLRLIALDTRGIWYDDAFSFFLAQRDLESIVQGTAADTMPPLYYFALHLWTKLGTDVATMRLLNVLVGLAIILLIFRLSDDLFGLRAAAAAALLTVVSPFHIYQAQELRMYGLLCLNLLLYLSFFCHIYLNRNRRAWLDWLGLMASGTLAMYSHNLAAFTLISANLLLLLQRRWQLLGRLVLAQIGMLLLAAPWLVMVPGQIAKIQRAFWTPRPGLLEVVQAWVTFHTNLPVPPRILPIAVIATVLFATVVTYQLVHSWRKDTRVQLLAAFACFPPLLIFGASYVMRPLFVPRGFILSSLIYYTLGALVIAGGAPRLVRSGLLGSFLLAALLALPSTYVFDDFPRSPFRSAVEFLCIEVRAGDTILHDNKLSYFPMHYYGPDLHQVVLPDEPGSHNDTLAPATQDALRIWPVEGLQASTKGASRIWFVFFTRARQEWETRGNQHPILEELEAVWHPVNRVAFNDLEVVLFERP